MAVPITTHVNVSISTEGTGTQAASFGAILAVCQTTVGGTSDRVVGPFASMSDVTDYGFTSSDNFYNIASAAFSQQPRTTKLYLGRRLAGDANVTATLNACQAEDGASWYGVINESRTDAEILEVAAWCESRFKLAMVQSDAGSLLNGTGQVMTLTFGGTPADGNYTVTFTGFGLGSPTAVTIARADGSPASNALLATAFAAELDTQNDEAGDIEGILSTIVDGEAGVVTITFSRSVARGSVTTSAPGGATITAATTDDDVARQLFVAQYSRTAIVYYPTDATFADAAWMSRCFAFDLDSQKGIWGFKTLNGISGTTLTSAQAAAIRSVNANYYAPIAPSSGVETSAYTAQGWLPYGTAGAGRRIDFQTTLDWTQARFEEALLNVLLRETHGVPYNDSGINRFKAAAQSVFATGLGAGHYESYLVPSNVAGYAGRLTPLVDATPFAETTTTQRANRTITLTGVGYVRSAIEAVTFNILVRQ